MNEIKEYSEEEILAAMGDNDSYIISSEEPLVVNHDGVPIRSFKAGKKLYKPWVERPVEEEVITKVDFDEFIKRNGSRDADRCYDVLEIGYWYTDKEKDTVEYEPVDTDFLEWRADNLLSDEDYEAKHGH